MFYPFLCGSFHHQEEDGDESRPSSPVRSPRKSKRSRKDTNNPYSTRGLDQFSALLAELEEKRQKIYSQTGSQSLVRFVYKNSNDCVPVVINLKDKEEKTKPGNTKERYVPETISNKLQTPPESDKSTDTKEEEKKKNKRFSWKITEFQNLRKPSYYIPAIIILILLFLFLFGRSVAVLCTCVGWYIVPTINGEGSNLRTSMKKKDYARRLSGNKLVSGRLSSPK